MDDDQLCPRCSVALVPEDGAGERCPTCGGHHLGVEMAAPLLEREVGRNIEELKTIAGMFGGTRLPCPGCGGDQSPVTLRGVPVDLCLSCGALWLDGGELSALTGGRLAETPPPPGDRTIRPRKQRPTAVAERSPAPPKEAEPKPASPREPLVSPMEGKRLPPGLLSTQAYGVPLTLMSAPLAAMTAVGNAATLLFSGPLLAIGVTLLLCTRRIEVDLPKRELSELWLIAGRPIRRRSVPFERVRQAFVRTHAGSRNESESYSLGVTVDGHPGRLSSARTGSETNVAASVAYLTRVLELGDEPYRAELASRAARRRAKRLK
jgi:Zn-finger nucleic acid-binding protein